MYEPVPLLAVTVAAPVEAPKQDTFTNAVLVVRPEAGCVIVIVLVVVQLLASVTVTVLTPKFKPLMTEVV